MKKVSWASLLAAFVAMIAGCQGGEPVATPGVTQTAQAHVVESQQQLVPVSLQSTGTVHARETAVISAQVMGRIQQVVVHEGDSVRAGQTLVVLDDTALRAQVDQAQAGVKAAQSAQAAAHINAALAESTLARYKQLESEKSVSPQEMDDISRRAEAAAAGVEALRAQADAARAQESGARTMLGYTRLVAPFAGVVTARMADPGTMAAPGVPLLQIDQTSPLQLQAAVDQSEIGVIHKGMKVPIAIEGAPTPSMIGAVAEIVPAADPSSHSFLVKVDLPSSSGIRPGMYGTANIGNGARKAILIPHSAVELRGSLNCVYVVDDQGIAQLRNVTLGAAQANMVEVLSGVTAGERLVDVPSDRDLAGKHIENNEGARP